MNTKIIRFPASRKVVRKQSKKVRRVVRTEPLNTTKKGMYILKTKCQSRVGWHAVGETGTFLNQGDGKGHFFPDRGGVLMNLPCTSVAKRSSETRLKETCPVPPRLAAMGISFTWKSSNSGFSEKPQLQGLAKGKVARSCKKKAQTKKRRVLRK